MTSSCCWPPPGSCESIHHPRRVTTTYVEQGPGGEQWMRRRRSFLIGRFRQTRHLQPTEVSAALRRQKTLKKKLASESGEKRCSSQAPCLAAGDGWTKCHTFGCSLWKSHDQKKRILEVALKRVLRTDGTIARRMKGSVPAFKCKRFRR